MYVGAVSAQEARGQDGALLPSFAAATAATSRSFFSSFAAMDSAVRCRMQAASTKKGK